MLSLKKSLCWGLATIENLKNPHMWSPSIDKDFKKIERKKVRKKTEHGARLLRGTLFLLMVFFLLLSKETRASQKVFMVGFEFGFRVVSCCCCCSWCFYYQTQFYSSTLSAILISISVSGTHQTSAFSANVSRGWWRWWWWWPPRLIILFRFFLMLPACPYVRPSMGLNIVTIVSFDREIGKLICSSSEVSVLEIGPNCVWGIWWWWWWAYW